MTGRVPIPGEMQELAGRVRLKADGQPTSDAQVLADWLEEHGYTELVDMVMMRSFDAKTMKDDEARYQANRKHQLVALARIIGAKRFEKEPITFMVDGRIIAVDARADVRRAANRDRWRLHHNSRAPGTVLFEIGSRGDQREVEARVTTSLQDMAAMNLDPGTPSRPGQEVLLMQGLATLTIWTSRIESRYTRDEVTFIVNGVSWGPPWS